MRWSNGASRLRPCRFVLTCSAIWIASLLAFGQSPANPTAAPANANPPSAERLVLIMIDPAHGGSDPGALLTPATAEKEITLAVARRLRQELSARGITSQLVRDSDATLSFDQRAAIANSAYPALYLAIHASSVGSGIRVFTAMMPVAGENRGPFLNWDAAQVPFIERSKTVQAQLVAAVQKTGFPVRALIAPLRPLNNLKVPAIAIEISPTTGDASQVASTGYQQMICAALANAIASIVPSLPGRAETQP
jgi:N-acetylmuramoyl-L-alanine amidase